MFILKIDKVICFDTLLQVFILKELWRRGIRIIGHEKRYRVQMAVNGRAENGRGCVAANTGKNSRKYPACQLLYWYRSNDLWKSSWVQYKEFPTLRVAKDGARGYRTVRARLLKE